MIHSTTLHVIARIKAKREHVDAVREILAGFVTPTRAEDGCLRYDLLQNNDDPTDFTFVEEWSSQPALDRHSKSRHLSEGRPKLQGLTEGPTQVVRYTQLM
jgi:quinol monooxygenase YgiN